MVPEPRPHGSGARVDDRASIPRLAVDDRGETVRPVDSAVGEVPAEALAMPSFEQLLAATTTWTSTLSEPAGSEGPVRALW